MSEKIILTSFVIIMAITALFALKKVNDTLSIEVPIRGGVIREGIIGYPRYINPLLSVTDAAKDLNMMIFSGLMKANTDGSLDFDLAESYTLSDDGLTYHFILKDNIYFHDNVPLTAYDIEFTIKKALDPIIKSPKSTNWEGVEVKVLNNKEIEFILKHPFAPFLENLTLGILPKHIWENVESDGFLFSQFNFEPVGSGPYQIKSIKRNAAGLPDYYRLAPFSKSAVGQAYIKDFYIYFFNNKESLLDAYKNNSIDTISSISPEDTKEINLERSTILHTPLPRIYGVFFNQNEATIFTNLEVKQALREATPKKEIIDNILAGFATPIEGPLPGKYSSLKVEDQSIEEGIEKAKKILEKAGWVAGTDGILEKKTKTNALKLSFSISTSNAPELKAAAMMLKDAWEKVGASVDVKVFDISDLNQNVIHPRKYDALLFGESIGRTLDLYSFWHSSERNDPGLNIALYTSSKVDKLLTDARNTNDMEKRLAIYQSFELEVEKDIPAIFLYSPELIYIVPKELKGISIAGSSVTSERFLTLQNWYLDSEKIWPIWQKILKVRP